MDKQNMLYRYTSFISFLFIGLCRYWFFFSFFFLTNWRFEATLCWASLSAPFSNSIYSLHVSASHYSNPWHISKFFIIIICVLVINHFGGRRGKYVYAQFIILNQNPIILLMPISHPRSPSEIASWVSLLSHGTPLSSLLSLSVAHTPRGYQPVKAGTKFSLPSSKHRAWPPTVLLKKAWMAFWKWICVEWLNKWVNIIVRGEECICKYIEQKPSFSFLFENQGEEYFNYEKFGFSLSQLHSAVCTSSNQPFREIIDRPLQKLYWSPSTNNAREIPPQCHIGSSFSGQEKVF